MKEVLKLTLIIGVFLIGAILPIALSADTTFAANAIESACDVNPDSAICDSGEGASVSSVIGIIINVLLFIVGLVSVIMIIIGGIRYTTSAGDSSAVTGAKNTILYAIVGLIIAFLAFAIVNWVLGALPSSS